MPEKNSKIRIAKGARRRGPFATIEEAIDAVRDGRMIIVVDDEDRENEGDLTMAAGKVTPEAINFMAKHGRGLICLAMMPERLNFLEIPLEVSNNAARRDTAFCVSIDAHDGTSTGISAADRARTVKVAISAGREAQGPRSPGSRVSVAGAARRRARAVWSHGSRRGPGADRGTGIGRRDLRNHERGRDHVARAGAHQVREEAWTPDDHDRGSDQVPDAHRAARQARRGGGAADGAWRLPDFRVREPAR